MKMAAAQGSFFSSRGLASITGNVCIPPTHYYNRDSDICWWCSKGRQTREHLFKECSAWKEEIKKLWKEVGEATAEKSNWRKKSRYKGTKGCGITIGRGGGWRGLEPGNTSIGTLLADERCIPAVLSFLSDTKCGKVKEGIIRKGGDP